MPFDMPPPSGFPSHQLSTSPPRTGSADPYSPSSPSGPIRNRHRHNPYATVQTQPSQAPTSSLARRRRQSAMSMNGDYNGNGQNHGGSSGNALDDMAKVEQALTLLSLHPEAPAPPPSTPHVSEDVNWPPHPSPETLLGNAIRQAVRALCDIRASQALVSTLDQGHPTPQRHDSAHSFASMSSASDDGDHGMGMGGFGGMMGGGSNGLAGQKRALSIEEIMQGYEKGIQGVDEVAQTLQWVQLWLKEERDAWRERLLK
ncbi:hypothetical protein BJ508DRAFT_153832 [Ascobolus immersus RN42]|uniref:Uncharacterized protein n=1 Tax=Ascobolus immersus RN42 TaxID=1160509 RepID=A0A3N4HXY2_ASCIM|nr:hypothetical protein BJ508DRAFT_153832 [Ascobolus immersus RN42]